MPRQYFNGLLGPLQTTAATAITGTAEADLLGAATWAAIPTPVDTAAAFRLRAGGILTTPASGATTMIMTLRWGTTTAGVSLAASAASATVAASQTNVPWELDASMIIRTIDTSAGGTTGSAVASGVLTVPPSVLSATSIVAGSTAAVAINTTTAGGLFVGMTLGGSASFTMTSMYCLLESLS